MNFLPKRPSLLEHLGDVRNHRCLVGGDSLPMHFALGTGTPCVTLFTCTSPWEIHDYGLQTKIVSPLLGEFFYKRGFDARATTAIGLDEVREAVDETVPCQVLKDSISMKNNDRNGSNGDALHPTARQADLSAPTRIIANQRNIIHSAQ